jgi:hypothetical protein
MSRPGRNLLRTTEERQFSISMHGPPVEQGRIPVELLADQLKGIQRLLFNIGSALSGDECLTLMREKGEVRLEQS